jgi:trigger factor
LTAATVKHLDPTQVELEIAISQEELDAAHERAFRELVKNVKIPGFRPGKVPRKIFEAQYGSELIAERARDAVIPQAYSRAVKENALDPVDQPQVELLPEEDGQPMRIRATVAVRPSIELKTYKGLVLDVPSSTVSEDDVDAALDSLRREAATLVPVDRPIELGDVPTLDYEGSVEGTPFEGGKAENQSTEIADQGFIPGFAAGIVGMRAGERKDVLATFPDDYPSADLAGKQASFSVSVQENKVRELPPLDDEFAKRYGGEGGTLTGLRSELQKRLETQRRAQIRRTASGRLVGKLLDEHDFPLPQVLVDRESAHLLSEAKQYVTRAGLQWDEYLSKQEKTEEALQAEYRAEAERRVKTTLLLEQIAKAEGIEATPKDVEAEVASLERQYQQPRDKILELLRPNLGSLVDGIVRSKTIDFLLDNAKLLEATPAART